MVIFGIQPTGRKHLGNHIGAILQYVEGQDRADPSIYCIVDLHAITVDYEPAVLRERVHDTTAILIAAGLEPDRCVLFRQGDVQEHTELRWLLSSVTALGELNRMLPGRSFQAIGAARGRLPRTPPRVSPRMELDSGNRAAAIPPMQVRRDRRSRAGRRPVLVHSDRLTRDL